MAKIIQMNSFKMQPLPAKIITAVSNRKFISILFAILSAVLSFILIYQFFRYMYNPRGAILSEWTVEFSNIDNVKGKFNIPYYKWGDGAFHVILSRKAVWNENDILILPKISGNLMKIYADGRKIHQAGSDLKTGNIWTQFHTVRLPQCENGDLKIELYGLYDIGIMETPYIIPEISNSLFLFMIMILVKNMYWISVGVTATLFILLTMYSFVKTSIRRSYILTGLGAFFIVIYIFEFIYRDSTGTVESYLLVRKILISSGFLGIWLISSGMESFFLKKKIYFKYFAIVTAVNILLLSGQNDPYTFKIINNYGSGIMSLSWIYIFILTFLTRNPFIIYIQTVFVLSAFFSFFNILFMMGPIYFFHLSFVSMLLAICMTILSEYFSIHEEFISVSKKSVRDPLTGAFNRYAIENIIYKQGDYIAIVDMNNFKEMNDLYGHDFGDRILIEWVNCVKENIRVDDIVIRYGGDEFILYVKSNPEEVLQRIKTAFIDKMDGNITFSYGIEKIETTIQDAITKADEKMYRLKKLS